jgi:hypothetical protein
MARENVKIPTKHYVGLLKRTGDGLPLGFMTPWGEDAAAVKRMQTVDNWARSTNKLEPMVIDNLPMSGFKLTASIRTTNYGGYDHWRVEDPRGFELEISGGNLAQLLSVGTVDCGEFIDECVWARHGSNNVLLSTATEEYKAAVENTRVAGLKTMWKDVKLGNRIVLQNNTRGVWLGKMYCVSRGYSHSADRPIGDNELEPTAKPVHVIYTTDATGSKSKTLYLIATPKLSYIEEHDTITAADAELQVNALLADSDCYVSSSGYRDPMLMSFDPIVCGENLKLVLVPTEVTNDTDLRELTTGYNLDTVAAKRSDGMFGSVSSNRNTAVSTLLEISVPHMHQGEYRKVLVPNKNKSTWYGSRSNPYVDHTTQHSFNTTDEYFNVELRLDTKANNAISRLLR